MVTKIDVTHAQSREQLHKIISTALQFPDYYGNNWDAFDECATDPDVEMPESVLIIGIDDLSRKPPYASFKLAQR